MQIWLNFWIFIFWLGIFGFLINSSNFLFLFFFSEVIWLILYVLTNFLGLFNDDLNLASLSFFILALAGLEFAFGFLLLISFKQNNVSFNFIENEKKNDISINNFNKINLNNYFWKK